MDEENFELLNSIGGALTMDFVMTNGDEFKRLLKKAQHDNAVLQKDLEELSHFTPNFKIK